jgi:hypothetical protein
MIRISTAKLLRVIDNETGQDVCCQGNESLEHASSLLFLPIFKTKVVIQCPICKLCYHLSAEKYSVVEVENRIFQ